MRKMNFIKKLSMVLFMMSLVGWSLNIPSKQKIERNNKDFIQTFSYTIFRLYNASSGRHYYTTLTQGPLYNAYPVREGNLGDISFSNTYPIYVFSKPSNGDRILTISEAERANLSSSGWSYEGIMGYTGDFPVPLISNTIYRYFNPRKNEHFYTKDYNELGSGRFGYIYEGVAFKTGPSLSR